MTIYSKLTNRIFKIINKKKLAKQKELEKLEKELEKLHKIKTMTVRENNLEAASWYRDKETLLQEKINQLKSK